MGKLLLWSRHKKPKQEKKTARSRATLLGDIRGATAVGKGKREMDDHTDEFTEYIIRLLHEDPDQGIRILAEELRGLRDMLNECAQRILALNQGASLMTRVSLLSETRISDMWDHLGGVERILTNTGEEKAIERFRGFKDLLLKMEQDLSGTMQFVQSTPTGYLAVCSLKSLFETVWNIHLVDCAEAKNIRLVNQIDENLKVLTHHERFGFCFRDLMRMGLDNSPVFSGEVSLTLKTECNFSFVDVTLSDPAPLLWVIGRVNYDKGKLEGFDFLRARLLNIGVQFICYPNPAGGLEFVFRFPVDERAFLFGPIHEPLERAETRN